MSTQKNHKIWLSPPSLEGPEKKHLEEALAQNWITTTGPQTRQFEKNLREISGVAFSLATSSGTSAIHLALLSIGVQAGDYVLCSSFTFAATAFPVLYCGAIPVFIDSKPDTWNMDPAALQEAIDWLIGQGKKPSAIMCVDIYGNPADYTDITSISERYGIPLIEDAAQALGSFYKDKMCGSFGACGIFSFNGNKIITTGGGGALLTNSSNLYEMASLLANQANSGEHFYQHHYTGYNYRMSNILAALGNAQIVSWEKRTRRKRAIFELYRQHITKEVVFQQEPPQAKSNRWLTCPLFKNQSERDRVFQTLTAAAIDCRFPMNPLHRQPVFARYPAFMTGIADDLFSRGLCIPSGTGLTDEQIGHISALINKA